MIPCKNDDPRLPVILVVQDSKTELTSNSIIINSFRQVYISIHQNSNILVWIQQNQPDLIILNLEWSKLGDMGLVTALRSDWLTQNIPLIAIGDCTSLLNSDCDARLVKPYSTSDLEKTICSLISSPVCLKCAS